MNNEEARPATWLITARGVWRRRKWLALFAFAAVGAAAAGLVVSLPDIYRATAAVLVERQPVPETLVKPSVTGELETRFQTVSQEILSRSRLRELILRFDLYTELRGRESEDAIAEQMRRDIRLELKNTEPPGGRAATTIAFTVSYRGRDPRTVAEVTNTLASFYVEENTRVRERLATGTAEFLKAQLAATQKRLEEREQRVRAVKIQHFGELPQQVDANRATLERLSTQLRVNSEAQSRALERRETLLRLLLEPDRTVPDSQPSRLAKLEQELAELRTRFTDRYPDVIRLKAEIAALEGELADRKPEAKPAGESGEASRPSVARQKEALAEVEARLKALREDERGLRQAIATYERRVENAPRWEQELQAVTRDYESAKELYYSLLKRYEDAQLAENMEERQKAEIFRILDRALPPEKPTAPHRIVLAIIGLLGSIGVAVAAAVLADQLDTSFHGVEELRAFTRVPVLASIPWIVTRANIGSRRWRFALGALAAVLAVTLLAAATHFVARGNDRLVTVLSRGA